MKQDPMTAWRAEHANFSALLDVLEEQVQAFDAGGTPNYDLMLDIVSYLRHFPDRFHHPREDVAVGFLLEQEPALQLPVNRLLQEHRVIAAAGEELSLLLNQVLDGVMIKRSVIEAAAALYLTYYRHHLASEDREILPRAARMLTPDQWRRVGEAAPPAHDPLLSPALEDRYQELRGRIQTRRAA